MQQQKVYTLFTVSEPGLIDQKWGYAIITISVEGVPTVLKNVDLLFNFKHIEYFLEGVIWPLE